MKVIAAGLALAAGLVGTVSGAAPNTTLGAVDPARLSEHIRILSSDAFEGRGPATPGEDKSVAYISGQMKVFGLTPAGDAGGWTQAVPLRRFETPGPISVSFTLGGTPRPLTELNDIVVHTEVPTDHVAVKDSPLVFIGYGVDAPERQWDGLQGLSISRARSPSSWSTTPISRWTPAIRCSAASTARP